MSSIDVFPNSVVIFVFLQKSDDDVVDYKNSHTVIQIGLHAYSLTLYDCLSSLNKRSYIRRRYLLTVKTWIKENIGTFLHTNPLFMN